MSLRLWLPLNGDLHNQGLDDVTVTNNGATVDNNGKIGKCYSFNRSTPNYLKIDNPLNTSINGVSIGFWVKIPSNAVGNNQIIHIGNGSGWNNNRFTCFIHQNTSSLIFSCGDGGGTGTANSTLYNCKSSALTLNEWTHVTCTYSTGKMKIYLNGVLDKDYDTSIVPSFDNTPYIGIGAAPNAGEPSTVYLNDVRIYDHCLSVKEVKELSKGLVLHYPLNRGGFGGDNIIRDTSPIEVQYQYPAATTYQDMFQRATTIVPSASQYTLSFYAKSTVNGDKIRAHYYNPNTTTTCTTSQGVVKTASDGNIDFTLTTEWKLYWVVYNQRETTAVKYVIFPRMFGSSRSEEAKGSGVVSVKCVKFEEGNKPTPWLPNSADPLYSAMGLNSNVEYDVSGYGNNLTSSAAHTYSSDSPRYNLCTIFSNASYNAYTASSKNIGLGGDSEFTISAWIYAESWVNDYPAIIWIGPNATNQSVSLIAYNGRLDLDFWNNRYVASTAMSAGVWHHVAATKTPGAINTTCKLYVDGVLVTGSANVTSSPSLASEGNIILGSLNDTVNRRWNGMISDVRVYTTALSADDILALYNTPTSIANNGTLLTQGEISEV